MQAQRVWRLLRSFSVATLIFAGYAAGMTGRAAAEYRGRPLATLPQMIVSGTVEDDSGEPIAGSYVCFGSTVVSADAHGVYLVKVKAALRIPVLLWAPDY